ncbi:hypothetical protein CLV51_103260 [Chitinophaga niastensis]|uniref:Uncharacterized protein n=1 Tax=Chitinophaga niastensis TaxID=536980 RepID=A0A2P8HJ83_CHINA|nr:hypothetical protein [Chitinophaga niastensis]PSL46283.1 hypothetical protein CLV51_103260 [Chitinophaga niastensis]
MKKALLIIFLGIFVGATLIIVFKQMPSKAAPKHTAVLYNFPVTFGMDIPKNLPLNADPAQLVTFAWNEFFALNWQSSYSYNSKVRGRPDRSWAYDLHNAPPYPIAPVVWETYAHRTELRPYDNNMLPFNKVPKYVYKINPFPIGGADLTLFNNLDEDNEIGSCDLFANTDKDGKNRQVLYQAKVNQDEYDYVYGNYADSGRLHEAINNTKKNIDADSAYYPGSNGSTCNCPQSARVFCLPCGGAQIPYLFGETYIGAIEVKTAWKEITSAEFPRYFTRTVITYKKIGNVIVAYNKPYGLIGIHIIHKTLNYQNFIFATFEHVDVEASHMGYVELKNNNNGPDPKEYTRAHPIPAIVDSSTAYVHRELKKKNPRSIWQYYRLVGVQGNPTNDSTSFSFFLANYVIESDSTLSNFRGSDISNPHNGGVNVLYGRRKISMGGCQGCHGVTQIKFGSDCSFLMNFFDKPSEAPDAGRTTNKLELYRKAFEAIDAEDKKTTKH